MAELEAGRMRKAIHVKHIIVCAALAAMLSGCSGFGAYEIAHVVAPDLGDMTRSATPRTPEKVGYVGTPEYFGPNDTIDRSQPSGKRPRDTAP